MFTPLRPFIDWIGWLKNGRLFKAMKFLVPVVRLKIHTKRKNKAKIKE